MCGIAGIFGVTGQPSAESEIRAMCSVLEHRGPDDEGVYTKGAIGLGMRRLSIIDLNTGHQPVHNEDGTIQVVLNGEIYNYRELRQEMEALGHTFYTDTDTEVIVHLYEEYGQECVHRLRGMFAFAVWDNNLQKLLLIRDRLGIKPLFYGEFNGRLVFASELKAILQLPEIDRELDWSAVAYLFTFLSSPAEESVVAGVHKLQPGHMLSINRGQAPQITAYWDIRFEPDYQTSEEEFVERLRDLIEESVRLRMVSDVPVGAFLSGGIDSSAVVANMARLSSAPVKTFSIGFTEKAYDEAPYARQVAQAFGTDHEELILQPDTTNILEDLAWHLDEPFGDSSAIPTYMVSRLASAQVKVVLSGDGGDELFAGYDKYRVEQKERRYRYIPSLARNLLGTLGSRMPEGMKGRNFLRHIALNGSDRYLHAASMFDHEQRDALFNDSVAEQVLANDYWRDMADCLNRGNMHWLSAVQYLDLKNYLPLDILTKVDRMSMANSLEARVPLLDHKLVEFATTIPPELLLRGNGTKHILKRALRGVLPDSIIDRRKQGFAVPLGHWFRGELEGMARELLLSETARSRGIFNTCYIKKLLALHKQGRPLDLHLWTLMSFELWCRTFLDQSRNAGVQWQFPRSNAALVNHNGVERGIQPAGRI